MSNVLLEAWTGPYGGVPPWDRVRAEDFPDALATALAERRAAVERTAQNPEPPTFENTLVALERTGDALDRVLRHGHYAIPQWFAEGYRVAYRGGRFEQPKVAPQYYQPQDWVLRTWWSTSSAGGTTGRGNQ